MVRLQASPRPGFLPGTLLAVVIALGASLVMSSPGQASGGTIVSVSSATGPEDSTVTSTVAISAMAAGDTVNAFDITLRFDIGVVFVQSATVAGGWTQLDNDVDNAGGTVHVAGSRLGAGCTAACNLFTVTWMVNAAGTTDIRFVVGANTLAGNNQADGGFVVAFEASGGSVTGTGTGTATATSTATPTATPTPTQTTPAATATTPAATATTATATSTTGASTGSTATATTTGTPTPSGTTLAGGSTITPSTGGSTPPPPAPSTQVSQPATSTTGGISVDASAPRPAAPVSAVTPRPPVAGTGSPDGMRAFEPLGYGAIALALIMSVVLALDPVLRRQARATGRPAPAVLEPQTKRAIEEFFAAAERRGRNASGADDQADRPSS